MRDEFKSGEVTARQAKLLNEMLDLAEQFRRLGAAPPLFINRAAGIPLLTATALSTSTDPTKTTTENLVTAISFTLVDGSPVVTYTTTPYTNYYNSSGFILYREPGTPVVTTQSINGCLFSECCGETPISLVASVRHTAMGTPLRSAVVLTSEEIFFDASGTTGGSGALTYEWYFDDPIAGTYPASPDDTGSTTSHTFSEAGAHQVLLIVRDADGCSVRRFILPVYVVEEAPECDCEINCPSGAPYGYTVEFHGGTEDFARYEGIWQIPLSDVTVLDVETGEERCAYELLVIDKGDGFFDRFGFAVLPSEVGETATIQIARGSNPLVATYMIETGYTSCCDPGESDLVADSFDAALAGDVPLVDGPAPIGTCDCSYLGCCEETTSATFTLAGVVDSGPDCECEQLNRAWTLVNTSPGTWQEIAATAPNCGGNYVEADLVCNGDIMELHIYQGVDEQATYEAPIETWVCGGVNEMTLTNEPGTCTGFPATLNVTTIL